ncbi:MAG: sugar transferase, partial [Candidatus Omnitrophota bacterium]|nr:sugar transferase [Candidatus Omnitrophota bacterium]
VFISAAFAFILKIEYVSRILFAIFVFSAFFLLIVEKWLLTSVVRHIRKKGYNYKCLLIVGSGKRAQNFIKVIDKHPEWGFKITGIVDNEKGKVKQKIMGYEIIGALEDIQGILHKRAIDEVVFVVPRSWLDKVQNSIAVCELEGVKATLAVDFFDLKIAHSTQTELEGIPLMTFEPTLGREGQLFIKRAADIIFSGTALIAFLPLFLITGALIKLTSPGPVFFAQKRVGRNGRRFILYKFRSMYYGAQKKLTELERLNEASGPVFKIKNDPRITLAGRFLRKFSIDELPQLFNVFMGDMSIVGPRPPLSREVQKYEPWQRRRLSMRPGLTCLWQVRGRNKIAFEEWMKLDLKYIDNWALWLDFKILVKTIPVVIFGIGAH